MKMREQSNLSENFSNFYENLKSMQRDEISKLDFFTKRRDDYSVQKKNYPDVIEMESFA